MTLKLYQWPSNGDLPNSGVFCMKLESYFRLANIPYDVVTTTSMDKSPKKTMPAVEFDGRFMSDSQLVIEHFEKTRPSAVDAFLSPEQRAHRASYRHMLEHHLVNILIYFRWVPDAGWNQFSRIVFAGAPAPVRAVIGSVLRRGTKKRLHRMGIARHTVEELVAFAKEDIDAVATLLGDKPFVFGSQISTLDLTVYAVISNILYTGVDMPLIALVKSHPNLVAHSSRVMKQLFQRDFRHAIAA